jgi:adenine deaminase
LPGARIPQAYRLHRPEAQGVAATAGEHLDGQAAFKVFQFFPLLALRGFGLQRGAIASTVAHDAHNVIVVGMSDSAMAVAVRRLANIGGGIVVVDGAQVLAEVPLPVAGLLSDAPLGEVVSRSRATVAAARELGCTVEAPFQLLSFLALSVIPSLKLTDRGLVDVDRFELVPLAVAE